MSDTTQAEKAPHNTPELAALIAKLHTRRATRRTIRRQLFWIRNGTRLEEVTPGLKEFIEMQFKGTMKWSNFTFEWDVGANEPLKVISPLEWVQSGGKLEEVVEAPGTAFAKKVLVCDPAAFTQQE